ncbi:EAL domain-containing protein [Aliivibrio sp. S3MY1]|uniref:EAL domain-containing protein n=1 Tax=unclassified Aliivibrio TaxID=2645654 RepID=UPI0023787681|nr:MULTISPECIES: EAL domain-containing protein [unclassified Aliivibrio]MDD9194230.1 EAL domain-containing protein [Aliivibrio sp. S3MY1]MDD9197897.1 EAL domain-containing protein [Aliivibrio sp. S2MY1]
MSLFKRKNSPSSSHSYIYDLSAIALLLLPLTLSNATAVLLGHTFNFFEFKETSSFLFHLSNFLINIYPLSFCVIAGYYLSHKTGFNSATFIIYSLVLFYLLSLENGSLAAPFYFPNNPLLALLSALITFMYCTRFNLQQLKPQALDFSSRLFKHLFHFFTFISAAFLLSKLMVKVINNVTTLIGNMNVDPLTFSGGLLYQTILGLLGSIGINGHNLLFAIKQTIYSETQQNMADWAAGEATLNIINQGFYDAFMSMGGSGNSISLLLCILLFSKEKNHIMLALAALPLVMFNINEVLLLGLPIIFNPLLIVPFITLPLISFLITYLAIYSGAISPVINIVNWMTPPLFSGYVAMGENIEGSILQLIIIVIGIFVYRPFYLAFSGKYALKKRASLTDRSMEQSIFRSLLDNVGISAATSLERSSAKKRLLKMLHDDGFVMHYQLLKSVTDKRAISFEALLRYQDREGKLCPPTFVSDFQLLNMMPTLDKLVIDKVLIDMQKMDLQKEQRIAINISVASIEEHDFAQHFINRLKFFSIPAHWLEIEITEEAILSNHHHLLRTLELLKSHGIKIAMDDFGTGYASFPHLSKYPFDKIKLDRSLLLDATTVKGKQLYQLIAQMGEIANCEVVAEGVETEEEFNFVTTCCVDRIQGFLISRPQPLSEALKQLREVNQR